MTVAATILAQLGGNKFIAMTGAKQFVNGGDYLMFSIGRNKSKANKVRVTLKADDTYTVEFFRLRGINCDTLHSVDGVYVDTLREVFTRYTGLDVSL